MKLILRVQDGPYALPSVYHTNAKCPFKLGRLMDGINGYQFASSFYWWNRNETSWVECRREQELGLEGAKIVLMRRRDSGDARDFLVWAKREAGEEAMEQWEQDEAHELN